MGVTDATRDAAAALNSGAIQLLRGMRAVDRESGLTPARLSALSVLVFGGPRGLGALARAEGVAGPTMTRIVDGLVAAGLAERRPHPADGRAVLVAPTPDGTALMHAARDRRVEAIAAALAQLPRRDRERLVRAAPLLAATASRLRAAERRHPGG
jgi:DNA-binding MarR family transcriptional regulator